MSDNGPEFTSAEFETFLETFGIEHQLTTPYHPTSNGAVERVNRTLQGFLRSMSEADDWDLKLSRSVISYNSTLHSELQMSPSAFILTKSHTIDVTVPLKLSGIFQAWRSGHPNFLPFREGQSVLMRVYKIGCLTVNKFSNKY